MVVVVDSCFGIYAEQVELWFKNSLPGTTTIQEAILSPFDCVEADNVGAGQSAPAERAVHLAYELLSCAMLKISTVHSLIQQLSLRWSIILQEENKEKQGAI